MQADACTWPQLRPRRGRGWDHSVEPPSRGLGLDSDLPWAGFPASGHGGSAAGAQSTPHLGHAVAGASSSADSAARSASLPGHPSQRPDLLSSHLTPFSPRNWRIARASGDPSGVQDARSSWPRASGARAGLRSSGDHRSVGVALSARAGGLARPATGDLWFAQCRTMRLHRTSALALLRHDFARPTPLH
jgi:hypothetical protein